MNDALAFLDRRSDAMVHQVSRLAAVNSYSHNPEGLAAVAELLREEFAALRPEDEEAIPLSPAQALSPNAQILSAQLGEMLSFRKRATAPVQVLLVIHYDTVYGPEHPFRAVRRDGEFLRGPGVADAKGGIVVMLNALMALEQSPSAKNLGWRVMLNPDEEIGSPGSAGLLAEAALGVDAALVYEPAPTADTMVTRRKGSGNFSVIFRGRSAHAGREIEKGRNAMLAAARFALDATAAVSAIPGATINVGMIDGGGPVNVVPDLAIVRFNVRLMSPEQQGEVERRLADLVAAANRDDVTAELHGRVSSPPWVMGAGGERLFEELMGCGRALGLELRATMTGGASDAKKIARAGAPVLDSLGPVGADIHSAEERVIVASLVERAKLSAMLLTKLATGEVSVASRSRK
jgi:glutamate carboxypeptidase